MEHKNTHRSTTQSITKAFQQLQDVVAMIARYAVMEKLYIQTSDAVSVKPEYQKSLISLCTTMLQFFEAAFELARHITKLPDNKSVDLGSNIQELTHQEMMLQRCEELLGSIKEQDRKCQAFKVVVETKELREDTGESYTKERERVAGQVEYLVVENSQKGSPQIQMGAAAVGPVNILREAAQDL